MSDFKYDMNDLKDKLYSVDCSEKQTMIDLLREVVDFVINETFENGITVNVTEEITNVTNTTNVTNSDRFDLTELEDELVNNDWTPLLHKALTINNRIKIPAGTYNFKGCITLPSYANILLDDEAVMYKDNNNDNMFRGVLGRNTTGYNGSKNVTIQGGTIQVIRDSNYRTLFSAFHMDKVHIENVRFVDSNTHAIDIIGCRDFTIKNCIFDNFYVTPEAPWQECIQIDSAMSNATGYPEELLGHLWLTYDGTSNTNITIDNNTFNNVINAIGSHTQNSVNNYHINVKITDNTINGAGQFGEYGNAIRLMQTYGAIVKGNIIDNVMRGILLDNTHHSWNNNGVQQFVRAGGCHNIIISSNIVETVNDNSDINIRPFEINCNNSLLEQPNLIVYHTNIKVADNIFIQNSNYSNMRIETTIDCDVSNNMVIGGTWGLIVYAENCMRVIEKFNQFISNDTSSFTGGRINGNGDITRFLMENVITTSASGEDFRYYGVRREMNGTSYLVRWGISILSTQAHPVPSMSVVNEATGETVYTHYLIDESVPATGIDE